MIESVDDLLGADRQRPLYIFDLDGTLADCEHRLHLRNPRSYDAFYKACVNDDPIHGLIQVMDTFLHSWADVWIFTGRSDLVRQETEDWLLDHTSLGADHVQGPMLQMRQHIDRRPDHELKREWYNQMLDEDKQRLVCVFEDRQRVVDMWRSLGVVCLQVAPGKF
jgi:hypothetical protein